jgi:hypothetical protein
VTSSVEADLSRSTDTGGTTSVVHGLHGLIRNSVGVAGIGEVTHGDVGEGILCLTATPGANAHEADQSGVEQADGWMQFSPCLHVDGPVTMQHVV